MISSFDAVMDLYLISTIDEKMEFIGALEDYEFESFFDYLEKNYPREFEAIP